MPAFNTRVTSITQDRIIPKVEDAALSQSFLTLRMILGRGRVWSGETLKKPVKLDTSTTGGPFSGLATFDTAASNVNKTLAYNPTGYYQSVVIPGIEKAVNKTDAQVISLVTNAIESAWQDMADGVSDVFYGSADGTGDEFTGVDHIILDSGSIGGLSRTTYPTLNATVTASGGTLTLSKMATLYSNVSLGGSNSQSPTYFVCDESVWDLYESLLTPTVRHSYGYMGASGGMKVNDDGGAMGQQGFRAVTYRGKPVVADEKANAQTLYAINENHLEWYGLNDSDLQPMKPKSSTIENGPYSEDMPSGGNTGMGWTGFKTPTNQYGEVGQIILLGNLVSFNPQRLGRLTGITSA